MGLTKDLGALPRAITVSSANNVGIGIAPTSKLHVSGSENSNWVTQIGSALASGHNLYFGYNNNTDTTYGLLISGGRGSANQLDFAVTNKFYINGNGNVLINTTTDAGYKLDVNGIARVGSALTVNTDGGFGAGRTSNNAGSTVVNIIGSSQSSTSAQLNLTQVWNGVSYPVVLRNTYNTTAGAASSVFTLSTSQYNGSIGGPELTERFRIDGNTGNVGIATAILSEKLNLDGNMLLRSAGAIKFNRSDNNVSTHLYDAGAYFVLDNRNANGFDFQATGTSHMRILPDGSVSNKGVKTQYASGNGSVLNTFYFDFVAYPSTAYKVIAGMTHWNAGYAAYKECVQFNDSYTNISELSIINHTSTAGGFWSISRPNSTTLRVTHNGGNYDGGANFWIQVIGV
jgi:hypothetical protein